MDMVNYFFSMPTPIMTILIIGCYLVMTWIVFFFCTHFIANEYRDNHTNMVTAVTQTVGTMYGLLLASIVVIILTNRNDVVTSVQAEANANACADIAIFSLMLSKDLDDKIHKNLKDYLQTVKNVEWKLLSQGKVVYEARKYIIHLQEDLFNHLSSSPGEGIVIQKIFDVMEDLLKARCERIESAQYKTHPYVWFILIAGSIIVIINCALFATRQTFFYLLVLSLISISISLIISLMVAFDRPLMGYLAVQPIALEEALTVIDNRGY